MSSVKEFSHESENVARRQRSKSELHSGDLCRSGCGCTEDGCGVLGVGVGRRLLSSDEWMAQEILGCSSSIWILH